MQRPLNEQIEKLKKTGRGKILHLARPVAAGLAAGLLMAGAVTFNPVFYGAALAAGILALAVWRTTPHMQNAARGLAEGMRQTGVVDLCLHSWPEVDQQTHETWRGVVFMNNQSLWEMDFVQPDGWEPSPGVHRTELAFIRGISWPVVLIFEDGILYPGGKPRPASHSQIMS